MSDIPALSPVRTIARTVLGAFLLFAGTAHLFFARAEFAAQVPSWMPLDTDFVVVASGIVEVVLGAALVFLPRWRVHIGWIVAIFFVAIFPGNIAQYVDGVDAFGLDTDSARLTRLFFQPALIAWALWSTGAWRDRRTLRGSTRQ
ncbi:DoxX family protein [Arthrobacter sp. TMT4-20]